MNELESRAAIKGFREWMAVLVILAGGPMQALVVSAMSPIAHHASLYFAKNGDGDLIAQTIVTVPAMGIILGGPLCGWLTRLLGAKRFFLIMLGVFGVVGSAGLYADSAVVLLATRFVLGITAAGIVTAMITMIGNFTPEIRARLLGYQAASGSFAAVLALLAAGQLGEIGGWRLPFSLYLLSFPLILLGAIYLPEVKQPVPSAIKHERPDYGKLLKLWPIFLMIIPMFVAVYMPNIQVSFLLRDDGVTSPAIQSYVILTNAATAAATSLVFGWLQRRIGLRWIVMMCFGFQGAGIAFLGLTHGALLAAVGCGILGMGTGLATPLIGDLMVSRTSPDIRSLAIGTSFTARYSGDFINPWIMHPLGILVGLHYAFVLVGMLFLSGVAIAAAYTQSFWTRTRANS